jgi:hypothetical protein
MRHHGLGLKGAQAVAEALEENVDIIHLDLTDNYIASGGFYFGKALKENTTITFLNLADNSLGMLPFFIRFCLTSIDIETRFFYYRQ